MKFTHAHPSPIDKNIKTLCVSSQIKYNSCCFLVPCVVSNECFSTEQFISAAHHNVIWNCDSKHAFVCEPWDPELEAKPIQLIFPSWWDFRMQVHSALTVIDEIQRETLNVVIQNRVYFANTCKYSILYVSELYARIATSFTFSASIVLLLQQMNIVIGPWEIIWYICVCFQTCPTTLATISGTTAEPSKPWQWPEADDERSLGGYLTPAFEQTNKEPRNGWRRTTTGEATFSSLLNFMPCVWVSNIQWVKGYLAGISKTFNRLRNIQFRRGNLVEMLLSSIP